MSQSRSGSEKLPQTGPEPALKAVGLGKRFGRNWALAHLDLEVADGEAVLLAGANGSGKTTLLRLIAGLYNPTAGRLEILGLQPTSERLASRRLLTMVSHSDYLYDRLTALETLRTWSRLLGRSAPDERLMALLHEVDLERYSDYPVAGFSAGMRKRLTLLRTRLEEPRIVLLDEPFSALDAAGKKLVAAWIGSFRSRGITVIMASHALERAHRLVDRAVLLEQGQIVWMGDPNGLLRRIEGAA